MPGTDDHDAFTRRVAVVSAVAALVVVRGVVALRMDRLSSIPDEPGFLGNAWLLGRGEPAPGMAFAPVYKAGVSVVWAPLAALFGSPTAIETAARLLSVALLAALVPLLLGLLARLDGASAGGPRWTLVGAAVAGGVVPATWVASLVLWPDAFAMTLLVGMLLAAWALARPGPWWRRVWLGPAAAWLWVTHDRFLPLLALVVAVLVARLVVGRGAGRHGRVDLANLALLALTAGVGWALTRWMVDVRWDSVAPGALDGVRADQAGGVLRSLVGQSWYLMAGSFGLAGLGLFAAGSVVVGAVRRDRRAVVCEPAPLVCALVVAGWAATVLATAVQLRFAVTFDLVANGRYQDVWAPVLVALGVVWSADRVARDDWVPAMRAGAVTLIATGVLLPFTADRFAIIDPVSISGVDWGRRLAPDHPVLAATAAALAVSAVLVGASRRRPSAFVASAVVALVLVGCSQVDLLVRRSRDPRPDVAFAAAVRDLGHPVVVDATMPLDATFAVQWRLAGLVGPEPSGGRTRVVVAAAAAPAPAPDAEKVLVSADERLAAWLVD